MGYVNPYDDPEVEANWIREQRNTVLDYLRIEGVVHGGVPFEPDYCCAPHATVWRVLSRRNPQLIGFWAIAGDLPTDYVSSNDAADVREVLRHFGKNWREVAECMKRGEPHFTITMGSPENWPELAPLLETRSQILFKIAEDDSLWEEEL